jgi:hypothetical protein
MSVRWPARLGLVSLSVLALAACNRNPNTEAPAGSATNAAVEATQDEGVNAEVLGASEAAAPVGPSVSKAAAEVSPDIAAAREFDTSVTNAAANTVDAYRFDEDGEEVRAWNDPRLGSRIATRGPDGFVVSYYRPGANAPYLMREGEVYYVLSAGRVVRAYDSRGRAVVLRDNDRDRWARIADRSGAARRAADRRHDALVKAQRQSRQAEKTTDKARENVQEANREANRADTHAERAGDKAQDAARDARREARTADTPAERKDAQQATRDANTAANKAEKSADRAEDAADKAREARRDARDARRDANAAAATLKARCDRARARGEKPARDCAGVR